MQSVALLQSAPDTTIELRCRGLPPGLKVAFLARILHRLCLLQADPTALGEGHALDFVRRAEVAVGAMKGISSHKLRVAGEALQSKVADTIRMHAQILASRGP